MLWGLRFACENGVLNVISDKTAATLIRGAGKRSIKGLLIVVVAFILLH